MTIPHTWLLCYVHEKEELYNLELLQPFFAHMAAQNCYVASDLEIGSQAIWKQSLIRPVTGYAGFAEDEQDGVMSPLQPSVSEVLQKEVQVYAATRCDSLTIVLRSLASATLLKGFEIDITFVPGEGYILLSVEEERFFRPTRAGMAKYRYWLQILEETYRCWHPLYVHEFVHQGPPAINPTWEDVQALQIPALYSTNIFGPELMQKLGQQRVSQTPAWLVKMLDDQGYLLIPVDEHGYSREKPFSYAAAAQHLGLPLPTPAEPGLR